MCAPIILEAGIQVASETPKECSYCGEESSRLVIKPQAYAIEGEVMANISFTDQATWLCLECLVCDIEES